MPKNLQGCYEVTMFRLLVRPQRPPVGGRELAALDAAGEGLVLHHLAGVAQAVLLLAEGSPLVPPLDVLPQPVQADAAQVAEGAVVALQLVRVLDVSPEQRPEVCSVPALRKLTGKDAFSRTFLLLLETSF